MMQDVLQGQEGLQQEDADFAALDDAQFLQEEQAQEKPQESADEKGNAGPDEKSAEKPPENGEDAPQDSAGEKGEEKPEGQAIDYAAFYRQIMEQPIAANGGKLQLRSPEEAVRLMQMGANYTRKMQELAPHRKALAMLQEHGLLDAGKLDFLVALDKKDPQAIKKYLADHKIDPLDMEAEGGADYEGGKYAPPPQHAVFNEMVDYVSASAQGAELIAAADAQWDAATKQSVYDNPDVLPVLLAQKQSGVYERIEAEIYRQKTLGQLPQALPFIQAYQIVGAAMHQSGAFEDLHGASAAQTPPEQAPGGAPANASAKPPPAANVAAAAITRAAGAGTSAQPDSGAQLNDAEFAKNFRI